MKYLTQLLVVLLLPMLLFLSCNPEDAAQLSLVLVEDGSTVYLSGQSIDSGVVDVGYMAIQSFNFEIQNIGSQRIEFTDTPTAAFHNHVYQNGSYSDSYPRYSILAPPPDDYLDPGTTADIVVGVQNLGTTGYMENGEGDISADMIIPAQIGGNPVDFTYSFYGILVC